MTDLKIGIVGCGRMGKERARCSQASQATVAAFFDIDSTRSSELARLYNAKSLARVDDCFDMDLDALFLCTAPGTRGPVEMRCIEAGLPLHVEKPIGLSVELGLPILSCLRDAPVLNAVGYMNRYRSSVVLARELLHSAEIIGFSAHWVCKRYNVPWWEQEQFSGGPHNEQATHLIDLCRYLVGDVRLVNSMFHGISRVSSSLECESGVLGTVFYSCDGNGKDIGMRIFTSAGSLFLSGWDFRLAENGIDGRLPIASDEDIFLIETQNFLEAVRLGRQSLLKSDFADALKTQAVMDALKRSAQQAKSAEIRYQELVEKR